MAEKTKKRVCILNGGGDCPGLNAVIRSIVKTCILGYGWEVWGSEDSFDGLIKAGKLRPLTLDTVRGILPKGGTILGTTNKGNPFHYPVRKRGEIEFRDYSQRVINKVKKMKLDAVIIVGGDGTLTMAHKFFQKGVPVVGIPKTIDNDRLCCNFGRQRLVS